MTTPNDPNTDPLASGDIRSSLEDAFPNSPLATAATEIKRQAAPAPAPSASASPESKDVVVNRVQNNLSTVTSAEPPQANDKELSTHGDAMPQSLNPPADDEIPPNDDDEGASSPPQDVTIETSAEGEDSEASSRSTFWSSASEEEESSNGKNSELSEDVSDLSTAGSNGRAAVVALEGTGGGGDQVREEGGATQVDEVAEEPASSSPVSTPSRTRTIRHPLSPEAASESDAAPPQTTVAPRLSENSSGRQSEAAAAQAATPSRSKGRLTVPKFKPYRMARERSAPVVPLNDSLEGGSNQKLGGDKKEQPSVDDSDSLEGDFVNEASSRAHYSPKHTLSMTYEDIEICQRLDDEYERALEEREVGWTARYDSVRQSACASLTFMLVYLTLGTVFFQHQTDWAVSDSLLFSIYTITTVGYGNHEIPDTAGFQAFTIFYIFVGIATLTIMVAQVYQWVALEATKAQFSRDKAEIERRANGEGDEGTGDHSGARSPRGGANRRSWHAMDFSSQNGNVDFRAQWERGLDQIFDRLDVVKVFLRDTQLGRGVSVVLPFAGLIAIGAVVVGPIEGWTAIESLYFAVVSLTTVGFGDYHPSHSASIWFCIFWLPFSIGFMSLYLGSVAHFYIRLSNRNIQRLEKQMRRRIKAAKEMAEWEREEARKRAMHGQQLAGVELGGDEGDDEMPPMGAPAQDPPQPLGGPGAAAAAASVLGGGTSRPKGFEPLHNGEGGDSDDVNSASSGPVLFGSPEAAELEAMGERRRERILHNSRTFDSQSDGGVGGGSAGGGGGDSDDEGGPSRPRGETMTTMRAVLRAVKFNVKDELSEKSGGGSGGCDGGDSVSKVFLGDDRPEKQFMSIQSVGTMRDGPLAPIHRGKSFKTKPSFALRVLVQERMAEIIATDIAGFQSHVEIKENTLSVTIDTLKSTADKWLIPRRARKAFRAVAFHALSFVGEHGLITRGADALYDLTPLEFHELFGPLLAAMGDADTMAGWLASTKILADVDLRRDGGLRPNPASVEMSALGKGKQVPSPQRASRSTARRNKGKERHGGASGMTVSSRRFKPQSVAANAFSNKR